MGRLGKDEGFEREQGIKVFFSLNSHIKIGIADPFDFSIYEGADVVEVIKAKVVARGGSEMEKWRHLLQFQAEAQTILTAITTTCSK